MPPAYPKCFGVSLLTNEARHFSAANSHLSAQGAGTGSTRFKLMVLGKFDHLALDLSDEREAMARSEYELSREGNPDGQLSYYGHLSYYGKFTYPPNFDWGTAYDSFGLAGFCTIRVRQGIRTPTFDEERRVGDAIASLLDGLEINWVIGFTTGWDDHVIFIFSKSYNSILRAIWKIRDYRDEMVKSEWLLTSCTLPLVRFDWDASCEGDPQNASVREARKRLLARLQNTILPDEQIGWAVRFAGNPGMLSTLEARAAELAKNHSIDLRITKLFGQADFRCADAQGMNGTQGSLFKFLVHVAFPLVTEPSTAIRNIETHLHLSTEELPPDGSATASRARVSTAPSRPAFKSQIDPRVAQLLQIGGIPGYTLHALRDVFRRIDLLQNSDLLAGEFDSLIRLRDQFNASAPNLLPEKLVRPPSLHQEVSEWLTGLERCISDRYRGIYPTGENITMRMATYHASHQKFLRVADSLIDQSASLALAAIEQQRRAAGCARRAPLGITAVAHLGNSPTGQCANNLRLFGTSFIELPVSEVFNFGQSEVLTHETGHHVMRAWLSESGFPLLDVAKKCNGLKTTGEIDGQIIEPKVADNIAYILNSEIRSHFHEILAELFSCSVAFSGSATRQWQMREGMLNEIFAECRKLDSHHPVFIRARHMFELRNHAVEALIAQLAVSQRPIFNQCLGRLRGLASQAKEIGCLDVFENVSHALRAICELTLFPEFRAILHGISPHVVNELMRAEGAKFALLEKYRRLLQSRDIGLRDSLDSLREAWSLIAAPPVRRNE